MAVASEDDIATRSLDPAAVIGANRAGWRRLVSETAAASARLMAAKETTTAERVRLAALVEQLVKALDAV